MTDLAETLAILHHDEHQRRAYDDGGTPWAQLHPTDKSRLVDVMEALLKRGVLAEGVPDSGDGFERELFHSVSDLPARFYAEGMVWLANRVLHPFGWAIGIMAEGVRNVGDRPSKVIGLMLLRTPDTDGIVISTADEVAARRNFFSAQQRGATVVRVPEEGPESPVCAVEGCGTPLWVTTEASGCPNPRCEAFVPIQREA
jgi:hypothetical protein